MTLILEEHVLTGCPTIDDDHRRLVATINSAAEDLDEGSHALCVELFEAILAEAEDHFAREEQLLAEVNYPKLAEHVQYHRGLSAKVRQLMRLGYEKQAKNTIRDYFEEMSAFVIDDVVRGDLELRDFLVENEACSNNRARP